jgi:general secretion pathway protein D
LIGGGGFGGQGGSNGLRGVTIPTQALNVQEIVRTFFAAAGVLLTPPNAVFFNERTGLLMVRATIEEIEIVEQAIEVLNAAPPMVQIEAKFAEVGQDDLKALGFDWILGNWLIGGGDVGVQAGTAPSYQGRSSPANPSGVFPGVLDNTGQPGPGTVAPAATDNVLTSGLRQTVGNQGASIPTLATITGLMTDPQFRVAIRALEQRGGLELMAAPLVTTLSGRQAQVIINDLRTIVTGVDLNQTASGGATATTGLGTGITGGGGVAPTLNYITQITPFGPVLDVIPYVAADGYTIELSLIPTFSEFLGYDDPGLFIPQAQSVAGNTIGLPLTAQLPLPRLRVRQVVTSATVWDGQTVVLGGLISEDIRKQRDKVPFLGDIPWVGRLFRTESTSASKRNLMVFITPTIIDPAGNPVHTADNLPFDPTLLPDQSRPVQ